MKFTLPVVCLALSIPTAVVAAASSGRLHGGGVGSIQAEKATAAEAAVAKAVRSLETKSGAHAASRGLRSAGVFTKAAFFNDVVSNAQQEQHRSLAGTCDFEQTLTKLQPTDDPMFSSRPLEFGAGLVIDGDWMVAGTQQNSTGPYQAIFIFKWDGSQWAMHQKIEYPANNQSAGYGIHSDISGDTIVVSAYSDNGSGTGAGGAGSVFVYRLDATDNDTWKQEQIIANAGSFSWYGENLRVDGDTLVIPARIEGGNTGAAYIYDRDCSSGTCLWSQTQKFTGENSADVFGAGVFLSGDTLFIGAPHADGNGLTDSGKVYYYTRAQAGGQWTLQQSFTPSSAMADDRAGQILAFDGETLFVPSWSRTVDGVWGVGYGWIYEQNSSGEWEVTQELENPSGAGGIYYGAWRPSIRGDTLVVPSRAGIDVWKKIDGSWALQKVIPKSGEDCEATAFHDDSLVFSCEATDGRKGSVYYLTCPDAFPAAAADGGDGSASAGGVATGPTQPGEWWDPAAWDITPYLTATCDAGFVTCCKGLEGECDAEGNPTSSTTCHDACADGAGGYDCCRNDSGTGIADACLRFTGKICRDGSCSGGDKACQDSNVGEVINGCQGKGACNMVGYNPNPAHAVNPVPRIHNSCRSAFDACGRMAYDRSVVGNVINSCNGNPDPDATDHWDSAVQVYTESDGQNGGQCSNLGKTYGKVGDVVNSCNGYLACALAASNGYQATPSTMGNIIRSCNKADGPHGYGPCSNAVTHGATLGDIVDSCNWNSGCSLMLYSGLGTGGNIIRSGNAYQGMLSMGSNAGAFGDVYDSCNDQNACNRLAYWKESIVGNIIGSCNAFSACERMVQQGGRFGDVLGSCLTARGCQDLARSDDPNNWDKSLTCCENESEAMTGTCDASSPVDTTLCSIGDAGTLASYCGSGSCPVGADRPASSSTGTDSSNGGDAPQAWDPTIYFSDCTAGFVECCKGYEGVCDADGNPTQTETTCHQACGDGASCCTSLNSCNGFTGKICKDGSCSDDSACKDTNVGIIVNSCKGRFACGYSEGSSISKRHIERIDNSCVGASACQYYREESMPNSFPAELKVSYRTGSIVNSCKGDHSCRDLGGTFGNVGDVINSCDSPSICVAVGSRGGEVGNIVNSCIASGGTGTCYRMGARTFFDNNPTGGKVGDVVNSCIGNQACHMLGIDGNVGDIIRSCEGDKSCRELACMRENGYQFGGLVEQVIDSCHADYACNAMAIGGGAVGSVVESCNGVHSCDQMAAYGGRPSSGREVGRTTVGDIIASCLGFKSCQLVAYTPGNIGIISGSCQGDESCRYVRKSLYSESSPDLICCASANSAGTCSSPATEGSSLCSDGDLSTTNAYCAINPEDNTLFCPAGDPAPALDKYRVVDQCEGDNNGCSQTCNSPVGTCSCNSDFFLESDGKTCSPTDKCLADQNGCSQVCNSPDGTCSCNEGYSLASDGKNCVDIDECSTGADNCDANASCQNTVGGFTCTCNDGYAGPGTSCTDINECTEGTHSCDANASCQNAPAGSHSCTCNEGYEGDGNICANIDECATNNGGCAHICTDTDGSFECSCRAGYALDDDNASCSTIYIGSEQSLPAAEAAAAEAANTVTTFFSTRSAYEVASHDLDVATTQLEDATTAHTEAQAKTVALTKKYEQAVAYEATMKKAFDDATARANADDATAAERYRLPIEAEIAYNEATAVMLEAKKAKEAAESEEATAAEILAQATTSKADATTAEAAAKTALDEELVKVNENLLIPKINPTTLDFPYVDTDGDLIPNDFDACPTQMGLRRNTDQRTSSDNPGPQDFCPSGCPETGADGTTILDSDGDGIPDCEDRCPFEAGIKYNHLWTWDKSNANEIDTLDANMAYHGCPDRDGDGIPDKFDACPTQAGGKCYSGCPDKGIDPVTQKAYDGDMDGVSDCDDRCPGFYGPGNSGGCPDGDFDGTPDYRDYCPSNPGAALFAYQRKLEGNTQKYMNILGCPDTDKDLVPDQADLCDAPTYPNQDDSIYTGLTRVAVVNNKGCPLDSDQDGVYDGIDNCDGTVHSANPVHDSRAIVFSPTDDGFSAANDETKLGCPKDTDNDGVADGIDQCPTEGGYIGRDGCPIDSDNDGVKDCVSTQAPTTYTWPFQPTACHSTEAKPDAACCTVEQDMCADTVRGATVYAVEYTHPKLDAPVDPGCSFDIDKDGVVDGVDLCPYTTETEIALAESNPNKVSIDDKGCATMSAPMWESTFVDVTTGSEGANPKVELLFTVDALLPQLATTRGYNVANELVAVKVMDASCTNTFDDETDAGDKLLPATVAVNKKGLFTGQTPTGSIPITIDVNLNPDNVVGSEVWTTEPPFDVGSIDFCLGFAVLSDTKKSVTYKELKTTILIDMTQDFAVTDISVERNEAEETTKLIDIEYPLAACQCTTDNTCVEDSDLDDSFLSQSDSLKLCVRFAPDADNNDVLPPDYVQMTDVKSFTCNQGGLSISPIVNFERQGDGGQLTSVETVNKELGNGESYTEDDRMLIVNTRLPSTFFGAEERPVDCVGTIVYEFAAGSVIDPDLVGTGRQRLLSETSVPLTSGQSNRRDAEAAPEAEAESEFSVEVMLAKAAGGRSLGVIVGAAVASALVVASGAAVTTMAIRRGGSTGVPKMSSLQGSAAQEAWAETAASTQEEGRAFTIANGAVA